MSERADAAQTSGPAHPHGLGLTMATALVVGNMIGAGIFLLPGSLAEFGGISLIGWLVSTAGTIALALVFVVFARAYPRDTGGPYAFARRAFGPFMGFQTAWAWWASAVSGQAAVTVSFIAYLAFFFPVVAQNRLVGIVVGVGTLWFLCFVNLRGTETGGLVQLVTTVIKILPLLVIGVVGLFTMKSSHFQPFNASGDTNVGAIIAATTLTLFAFIGMESASVGADKVRDPQRNVPIATVGGVVIAAVLYIIGTIGVLGVVPRGQLLVSTAPFADAGREMFGTVAAGLVAGGAIVSVFGVLNGWTLLTAEMPLAAARDGLFPRSFAKLNRRDVPAFGMIVSTAIATGIFLMSFSDSLVDQFTQILLMSTLATLVPYAYAAAAQLVLLVTDRSAFDVKALALSVTVAALAFAYSVFAILGSGNEIIAKGFLLLLASFPVYVLIVRRERARPPAGTTSEPVEPVAPQPAGTA